MAQNSGKTSGNSIQIAPCAVQWRHGATYRGIELSNFAQLRHAQYSCAMAQLNLQFPLFCLRNTLPSTWLFFH
ncbi:hypothetical protein L195_g063144, partial [Trifolium pratense]